MTTTLITGEVGYDIPARPGDAISAVMTPALIIDMEVFERNLTRMRDLCAARGLRLRAHAKTHKSADIALRQMAMGAVGVCCQKVSEAEALARAGVSDILISNQIAGPARAARVAALAGRIRLQVCADDAAQIRALSAAAQAAGTEIGVLVEIDNGAGRCGVAPGTAAVPLAQQIAQAPGLRFDGIQSYQGALQHIADPDERRAEARLANHKTRATLDALAGAGITCHTVGGAGTGSLLTEAEFGLLNEVQCGSYIFMDADYDRVCEASGSRPAGMENALFVLSGILSTATPGRAVCDAGLKAHSVDSGLPRIDTPGLRYVGASDEHGTIDDPGQILQTGDQIRLVPGHCDPTCNLHDWYVCIRNGQVEALWPVTARGKLW